ncbi:MAG TPA: hypothetical protein VGW34_10060 [Allosphingosinicella sp.]|nr:hypothetical protein [Allosphingosinicella sp.]
MKFAAAAIAALTVTAIASPAASAERGGGGDPGASPPSSAYVDAAISRGHGPSGRHRGFGGGGWRDQVWDGRWSRHHGLFRKRGFFGRDRLGGGYAGFGGWGVGVTLANGPVLYDYDRGYPYDHFNYGERGEPDYAPRRPRCDTEWTWDARAREEVPVRVCRN